jgi:hypothetical protein
MSGAILARMSLQEPTADRPCRRIKNLCRDIDNKSPMNRVIVTALIFEFAQINTYLTEGGR